MSRIYTRFYLIILLIAVSLSGCGAAEPATRVALLGDSNTWLGGDGCDSREGWSWWLAQQLPDCQLRSFARSGATWAHTSSTSSAPEQYTEVLDDNNVIYNQIMRLADSDFYPDVILAMAGTNDAWFVRRRPGLFDPLRPDIDADAAPGSVIGLRNAVAYDLKLLQRQYPEAQIVIVTCLPNSKAPEDTMLRVNDLLAATAADLGASVLRPEQQPEFRQADLSAITRDGVHLSAAGAKMMADYIARSLCQLKTDN